MTFCTTLRLALFILISFTFGFLSASIFWTSQERFVSEADATAVRVKNTKLSLFANRLGGHSNVYVDNRGVQMDGDSESEEELTIRPQLGNEALPTPHVTPSTSQPSPTPSPSPSLPLIVFLTTVNAVDPNRLFCNFLRGIAFEDFPSFFVLGWEGANGEVYKENKKKAKQLYTREFYLGSKLTLTLKFIEERISNKNGNEDDGDVAAILKHYNEDSFIFFVDGIDSLVQHSFMELQYKLQFFISLVNSTDFIIFSTEHDPWPPIFASKFDQYWSSHSSSSLPYFRMSHVYHHLNSGGFIGTVKSLRKFLKIAIEERDEYKQHQLVYNAEGKIAREGDGVVEVTNVYDPDKFELDPLTQQPTKDSLQSRYVIPGVYKRNDQIIASMIFFSQSSHGLTMYLDSNSMFFQSMQLSDQKVTQTLIVNPLDHRWRDNKWKRLTTKSKGMNGEEKERNEYLDKSNVMVNLGGTKNLQTMKHFLPILPSSGLEGFDPFIPSFIHYNGPSKDWMAAPGYKYGDFSAKQWMKLLVNSSIVEGKGLEDEIDKRVLFFDRRMKWIKEERASIVCHLV